MVDHLPKNVVWNVSVMNPEKQWDLLSLAVSLGGHVRVGYEDNPYIAPASSPRTTPCWSRRWSRSPQGLGRDIATPEGSAKIFGLYKQ